MLMQSNFLKPKDVAEHLNISLDCVYKLIKSNKLKALNFSSGAEKKSFRIKMEDLEEFKNHSYYNSMEKHNQKVNIKQTNHIAKHNKLSVISAENLLNRLSKI